MIENLPVYIPLLFILTTLVSVVFLYKASHNSFAVLGILLAWIALQSVLTLTGFYQETKTIPPRFLLLPGPPLLAILLLFILPRGRKFLDSLNLHTMTWLHVVRIPVEIVLLLLFLDGEIPRLMTFEGRNFDIISGVTAPLIGVIAFIGHEPKRILLLAWNFLCLVLLLNIVINAVLSAPTIIQQFAFEQPNEAIFYFPFTLLPAVVVPVVLLSHLASIRQLLKPRVVIATL